MNAVSDELWAELLAEADAVAAEYREDGWEVVAVEPGAVSPAEKDDRFGLSVLLQGSEYDAVEGLVDRDGVSFDETDVYRNAAGDVMYVLAIELDTDSETAVVVPMAYSVGSLGRVLETALEEGELGVHLRPLSIERWVTFTHDEPSLFVGGSP